MDTDNPFAPPRAQVADVAQLPGVDAPALWNPNAAGCWSLLFSPVFGALVHMKNWQRMGEPRKAELSRRWAIVSAAFLLGTMVLSLFLASSGLLDLVARTGGIILLIAWYYAIGKAQNAVVVARYGKNYPRRSLLKPLGLAVLVVVVLMAVLGLAGAAMGSLAGAG